MSSHPAPCNRNVTIALAASRARALFLRVCAVPDRASAACGRPRAPVACAQSVCFPALRPPRATASAALHHRAFQCHCAAMSRPILPFPPAYAGSQQPFYLPPPDPPPPPPPPPPPSKPIYAKRGRITIVACLPCRRRKTKVGPTPSAPSCEPQADRCASRSVTARDRRARSALVETANASMT